MQPMFDATIQWFPLSNNYDQCANSIFQLSSFPVAKYGLIPKSQGIVCAKGAVQSLYDNHWVIQSQLTLSCQIPSNIDLQILAKLHIKALLDLLQNPDPLLLLFSYFLMVVEEDLEQSYVAFSISLLSPLKV